MGAVDELETCEVQQLPEDNSPKKMMNGDDSPSNRSMRNGGSPPRREEQQQRFEDSNSADNSPFNNGDHKPPRQAYEDRRQRLSEIPAEEKEIINDWLGEVARRTCLDESRQQYMIALFNEIKDVVTALWTEEATAEIFGSAISGSANYGSDFDVGVIFKTPEVLKQYESSQESIRSVKRGNQSIVLALRELASKLRATGLFKTSLVENARVPVLKVVREGKPGEEKPRRDEDNRNRESTPEEKRIAALPVEQEDPETVDACFDIVIATDLLGFENSKLLQLYLNLHTPHVATLAILIKRYFKLHNLCDAFTGTLSSYSYMLLLVHFLQEKDILPNLQDPELLKVWSEQGGSVVQNKFIDFQPNDNLVDQLSLKSAEDTVVLFQDFLNYWAKWRCQSNIASVHKGNIPAVEPSPGDFWFRIQDPLEEGRVLGMSQQKWQVWQQKIRADANNLHNRPNYIYAVLKDWPKYALKALYQAGRAPETSNIRGPNDRGDNNRRWGGGEFQSRQWIPRMPRQNYDDRDDRDRRGGWQRNDGWKRNDGWQPSIQSYRPRF